MARLILAFLLLLMVYLFLRKITQSTEIQSKSHPLSPRPAPPASASANPLEPVEEMVQCRHCGVYVPRNQVIFAQGLTFCSQMHCDQHLQAHE